MKITVAAYRWRCSSYSEDLALHIADMEGPLIPEPLLPASCYFVVGNNLAIEPFLFPIMCPACRFLTTKRASLLSTAILQA